MTHSLSVSLVFLHLSPFLSLLRLQRWIASVVAVKPGLLCALFASFVRSWIMWKGWSWGDHRHHHPRPASASSPHSTRRRAHQKGETAAVHSRELYPLPVPFLSVNNPSRAGMMEVPTFLLSSLALIIVGGDVFTRWDRRCLLVLAQINKLKNPDF